MTASTRRKVDLPQLLERYVDEHGLTHVVNALAIIAEEKADHIAANWQDKSTAKVWLHDAKVLDGAARRIKSDGD